MAGYLRHLADKARQPESALHAARALPLFGRSQSNLVDEQTNEDAMAPPPVARARDPGQGAATLRMDLRTADRSTAEPALREPSPRDVDDRKVTRVSTTPAPKAADANVRAAHPQAPSPLPEPAAKATEQHSRAPRLPGTGPGPLPSTPHPERASPPTATAPKMHLPEARPPQPAADRTQAKARPPSIATTTEVHIHIGRIELSAVASDKPVKTEARGGKKPLSLDEYLKQRGRPA